MARIPSPSHSPAHAPHHPAAHPALGGNGHDPDYDSDKSSVVDAPVLGGQSHAWNRPLDQASNPFDAHPVGESVEGTRKLG